MRKEFVGGAVRQYLSANILSTDTSFAVSDGTSFPTGSVGPFVVAIGRGTANEEKILCSAQSAGTFTVQQRGYDGTTAKDHTTSEYVSHVLDSVTIDEANAHANDTTGDPHPQYNSSEEISATLGVGWHRFALNGSAVAGATNGNRAAAMFHIIDMRSSYHSSTFVYAGYNYGNSPTLTLLGRTTYAGNGSVQQMRLIEGNTYEGAALEIYVAAIDTPVKIVMRTNDQTNGWDLQASFSAGEVPAGFAATTLNFTTDTVMGFAANGETNTFIINRDGSLGGKGLKITGSGPAGVGNAGTNLFIEDTYPQIEFHDTDQSGAGGRWWFHVNSGNFYLLADRNDDAAWESPHPMMFNSSGELTLGESLQNTQPTIETKRVGDTHSTARNVLNWGNGGSALTGYLVIKTNMAGSYNMSHLHITGYSYEGGTAVDKNILDLVVSGYLRPSTVVTVNGAYTNRGRHVGLVRWAQDANGNAVLIIGSPTDVWRYPQITVDWFKYRHGSARSNANFQGWTIGIETDISGYTYPYDVPNTTPGWQLIESKSLSAALAGGIGNVFFSGIPAHYTKLKLICPWIRHTSTTASSHIYFRLNSDSAANYGGNFHYHSTGTWNGSYHGAQGHGYLVYAYFYGNSYGGAWMEAEFSNHASTRAFVMSRSWNAIGDSTGFGGYGYGSECKTGWDSTAKINRIDLWNSAGYSWEAGSKFNLWGLVE